MALDILSKYFQWPDVLQPLFRQSGSNPLQSSQTVGLCTENTCVGDGGLAERDVVAGLENYLQGVFELMESPRSGDNEIGAVLWKVVFEK